MHIGSHLRCMSFWFGPLCLGLGLASCAGPAGPVIIDGKPYPRPTTEYVGRPYSIRHIGAYPQQGNPSAGLKADGGQIAGTVCGADIQFHVSHNGDHVRVNGFVNNEQSATLEIREANGIRRIQGGLGNFAVDVLLANDILAGTVGRCRYELHPDEKAGDTFAQALQTQGYNVNMRIGGRQALEQLPAADQAALVPLILYCATAKLFENLGHDPPELGFGGQAGAQPPKTINFGVQGARTCG